MLPLSQTEAYKLQYSILNNQVSTPELIKIFQAFSSRELTAEEFLGLVQASMDMQIQLDLGEDVIDMCGTGGDGLNTFNISSLVAIVCASGGLKVAKHGNRSSGGKCGGGDILEALGIAIDLTPDQTKELFAKTGFCFLFAPIYNPAFKFAKEARVNYGKTTYFNLLGPLLNPAKPKYQLLGINDFSKSSLMANCLKNMGLKAAWIVNGSEGMDELSPCGPNQILKLETSNLHREVINPKDLGLSGDFRNLIGGDLQTNLYIANSVLKNTAPQEQIEAVALNAGACFTLARLTPDLQSGLNLAKNLIQSGQARAKLEEIKKSCQAYA